MPVILDGTKPLWSNMSDYVDFIMAHLDEFYDRYREGDEYADLIVCLVEKLNKDGMDEDTKNALAVCVERYIHDWHSDIATIKGGYPKEAAE